MQIDKNQDSNYAEELLHLSVCALLHLAIKGISSSSPLNQTRKLHSWLLTAKKRKLFSVLVASDINTLISRAAANSEVVSTLWDINKQYSDKVERSKVLRSNKDILFDAIKYLESVNKIKTIFVEDKATPIRGKKGERKVIILESHFEQVESLNVLSLFLIGNIKDNVMSIFTRKGVKPDLIQSGCQNDVIVNQVDLYFG